MGRPAAGPGQAGGLPGRRGRREVVAADHHVDHAGAGADRRRRDLGYSPDRARLVAAGREVVALRWLGHRRVPHLLRAARARTARLEHEELPLRHHDARRAVSRSEAERAAGPSPLTAGRAARPDQPTAGEAEPSGSIGPVQAFIAASYSTTAAC